MKDYKYEIFVTFDTQDGSKTTSTKIDQDTAVYLKSLFSKFHNTGFGYYWCVEDYKIDDSTKKKYENIFTDEDIKALIDIIGVDAYGYCNCVEGVKMVPIRDEIIILK